MAAPPDAYVLSAAEERVLNHEILFQVWSAQFAWENLPAALMPPELGVTVPEGERRVTKGKAAESPEFRTLVAWQVRVWTLVRSILSAAAVVSLVLWPITRRPARSATEKRRVARAAALQAKWGLPPDSVLSDRDARDVFEHVDEKLVTLLQDLGSRPLVGLSIAEDPRAFSDGSAEVFRRLDPVTKVVWAGGKRCDLGQVVAALVDIAKRLPPTTHRVYVDLPRKG
jgi:hypothetical protein